MDFVRHRHAGGDPAGRKRLGRQRRRGVHDHRRSFGPVCGAMAADYLLAGRKWPGPRAGFNPAGWISWIVGFAVGSGRLSFQAWINVCPVRRWRRLSWVSCCISCCRRSGYAAEPWKCLRQPSKRRLQVPWLAISTGPRVVQTRGLVFRAWLVVSGKTGAIRTTHSRGTVLTSAIAASSPESAGANRRRRQRGAEPKVRCKSRPARPDMASRNRFLP